MSTTLKVAGGDAVVDAAGRFVEISELEKVDQDIRETYMNNYDPFDPPWHPTGSEFFLLDEETLPPNADLIETRIRDMAAAALDRLLDAQEDDVALDDAERIDQVKFIQVWQVGSMSWAFYSKVVTDSDEFIDTNFEYEFESDGLPDAVVASGGRVYGDGTPL